MATIKSFTSLEQSKVLAEILPIESADMRYHTISPYNPYPCDEIVYTIDFGNPSGYYDIPCWSLAALLNYLREIDFFPEIDANELEVTMSINYYNEDEAKPLAPVHNIKVKAENFIDACVEVILNLHKLNLL